MDLSGKLDQKVDFSSLSKQLSQKVSTAELPEIYDTIDKLNKDLQLKVDKVDVLEALESKLDQSTFDNWAAECPTWSELEHWLMEHEQSTIGKFQRQLPQIPVFQDPKDFWQRFTSLEQQVAESNSKWKADSQDLHHQLAQKVNKQEFLKELDLKAPITLKSSLTKRINELAQAIDLKADLKELQQIRKDNSTLADQMFNLSRRVQSASKDADLGKPNEKILARIEQIAETLQNKADAQELMQIATNLSQYVTSSQLVELLALKVDNSVFTQQLSEFVTKKDLAEYREAMQTSYLESASQTLEDMKQWFEHEIDNLAAGLALKVGPEELLQVQQELTQKVDVNLFLSAKSEWNKELHELRGLIKGNDFEL